MSDLPEPDRAEGVPHPRHAPALFGQGAAEAAFLAAHAAGRLHHGWLITGPRGVGKATLAWRIARFLLATPGDAEGGLFGAPPPPATLDIPAEHPVGRRIAALSEGRLKLIRRSPDDRGERLRSVIAAEDVRDLSRFFGLSAADGGRRVVIVDAADEMNPSAANALLKLLEEPPAGAVLLLVSHQPAGLLPTIRSRCRELRCVPLGPDDLARALAGAGVQVPAGAEAALAALAGGSAGAAAGLIAGDGLALYRDLLALVGTMPALDRPRAIALAETAAARGAEARLDMLLRLVETLLARLARTGAAGPPAAEAAPGEAALLARLAPDAGAARAWAEAQQTVVARVRRGRAVNLDPAALLLDMLLHLNQAAARLAPR
jgi:DNA polymerase-3 subunit delta'